VRYTLDEGTLSKHELKLPSIPMKFSSPSLFSIHLWVSSSRLSSLASLSRASMGSFVVVERKRDAILVALEWCYDFGKLWNTLSASDREKHAAVPRVERFAVDHGGDY
jgi:hypothetical protein